MKKFFVVFLSVILCLSCFGGFRVSAEDDSVFTGDIISYSSFVGHEQEIIDFFESNIGSIDDYFFFACNNPNFSNNFAGMYLCYIKKSDYDDSLLTRDVISDSVSTYTVYTHSFKTLGFNANGYTDGYIHRVAFDYNNNQKSPGQLRCYSNQSGTYTMIGQAFCTNIKFGFSGTLKFLINPDFTLDMYLDQLAQTFTLEAINDTDNYYNYMMYISPSPASIGIYRSIADSVYIMSSTQWCMKYTWKSTAMTSDDLYDNVRDWIIDSYGRNIFDSWGNAFDIGKSYYNSQGDGFNYYQLSQQDKSPFYLVKPDDVKTHVIPYSALNLELNKDYYVNIIYLDTTEYGVVPTNTSPIDFNPHNSYRDHPIYNLDLLASYTCYCALQFNFAEGIFSVDDDGLYNYNDVVNNANPDASSATISSDDDTVDINTNTSYDNSSSISYINYGTIYHNCTWGGAGGSSGGSVPVPDVPVHSFTDLLSQTGDFLDFVKEVLTSVGAIPLLFITGAFAVLLYLRIWGR